MAVKTDFMNVHNTWCECFYCFILLIVTETHTAPTTPWLNPNRPRTYRQKRPNCTPPAIEQFPPPLLPAWFREKGGLIIHVLIAIFTFLGLAIVCDDYFVSSLDRICEELRLSPDVAGATFMAAGSYMSIIPHKKETTEEMHKFKIDGTLFTRLWKW